MILSRLLTISALAGPLVFATAGNEYHKACEAAEAVMSDASNVYYPGNSGPYRRGELEVKLTRVQVIHHTPEESTILSHRVKKILRA